MTIPGLTTPLALPCGATLRNRIAKAAMTEGLGDPHNRATEGHVRLYRRWAEGGAGLLITGNIQIDRRHLERPGNVAIAAEPDAEAMARLKAYAAAATAGGTHAWVQISHAGRQTPRYVNPHPKAPSAVKLGLPGGMFGEPVAMTEADIAAVVMGFARAARVARTAGFTGVQVHAAHGYLLSAFLSPRANRRTDAWGGPIVNRARLLLDVVAAVRAEVGPDFPVAVKLNAADFQRGGFDAADSLAVIRLLNAANIDLLEISGGTYEQPRMAGMDGLETPQEIEMRASTRAREAYFLAYAAAIRAEARMPLMVTGGFRTRGGMDAALAANEVDVIGVARPLCGMPDAVARLLDGRLSSLPSFEAALRLGPGRWLGPHSPVGLVKMVNGFGIQGWFCHQLLRMGQGLEPDLRLGVLKAFMLYRRNEEAAVRALVR